jgi:hypothetical protein
MRLALALLLLSSNNAHAAWPEDVSLTGLGEHDGAQVLDTTALSEAYGIVARELGAMVANKPHYAAETLGASGFEFAIDTTVGFHSVRSRTSAPAPWERVHSAEDPFAVMVAPTFSARKGLPFSLEVGGTMSWMALSSQGVFSGFARFAPLEGFKPAPDISVHVGYSGYVGNEELEVGVVDFGFTIGGTYAIGPTRDLRATKFSPWFDFTTLRVSAIPILDLDTMSELGVSEYRGSLTIPDENLQPSLGMARIGGGFQVTNGSFLFRLSGSWVLNSLPTATVGLGFVY